MKATIFVVITATLAQPIYAGQCVSRQRVVRRAFVQQHYVAPVVAHGYVAQQFVEYPVQYQVGVGLREEAVAKYAAAIAREEGRKDLIEELRKLGLLKDGAPSVGLPPDSGGANDYDAAVQAIANRSCVRCHGGAKTEANLSLVDVTKLTKEQRLNVGSSAFLGLMPQNAAGEAVPLESDAEANFMLRWSKGAATAEDLTAISTPTP